MGAKVWHWKKRIGRVLGRLALAVIFFAGVLAQDVLPVSAQQTATTTVKLERGQKLELLVDTTTDSMRPRRSRMPTRNPRRSAIASSSNWPGR